MDLTNVDDRFKSVFQDHRFLSIKQKQRKVKIDRRFQSMFTDDKFKLQYKVDKRGKPAYESATENLKKYYHLSNKEKRKLKLERKQQRDRLNEVLNESAIEGDSEVSKYKKELDDVNNNIASDGSSDDDLSSDFESDEDSEPDLARGVGNVESSSSEDEDEFEDLTKKHDWSELDADAQRSDDVSSRLALCNMDWERITASDLFVLFESFKTTGGSIKHVTIYPSDYGVARMATEYTEGPAELKEVTGEEIKNADEKEEQLFQQEKLREHEINRLKYYYAVIQCDSATTADGIYQECDGMDFEASSSKLDLRFIPEDIEFNDHPPKDTADQLPDKDLYKPSKFITKALNQTKVGLSWDETDHKRLAVTMRKFTKDDLENMDMKDFIASSSSEEEEEEEEQNVVGDYEHRKIGISSKTTDEDQIARYRSLLLGDETLDDKPDDMDMEITWEPDLLEDKKGDKEEDSESGSEDEESEPEEVEATKDQRKKHKQHLQEESDPKEKAELEMLMMDADDARHKHFDIKEILKDQQMSKKKKRKLGREEDDDFKINTSDSRFSAVYTSPAFALDPNNPAFRKTKGMKELISERQNRLVNSNLEKDEAASDANVPSTPSTDSKKLDQLVNSVKLKTKRQFAKKITASEKRHKS